MGLLGTVQLVPLAADGAVGRRLADAIDRRKLLIGRRGAARLRSLALAVNSLLPHPSVALFFVVAGVHVGGQRLSPPALEAHDAAAGRRATSCPPTRRSASLRGNAGAIAGPALAGVCIATLGLAGDLRRRRATFAVSLVRARGAFAAMPPAERRASPGCEHRSRGCVTRAAGPS